MSNIADILADVSPLIASFHAIRQCNPSATETSRFNQKQGTNVELK